jgi:1-deoxy-D-xylulose 5-phosphate reductoisomerase
MEHGGSMPLVFNVANQVFVEQYLNNQTTFYGITDGIAKTMDDHQVIANPSISDLLKLESDLQQQLKEQV